MIQLMILTLREPSEAWRRLCALNPTMGQRWGLVALTSILSALLSFGALRLYPVELTQSDTLLVQLARMPVELALVQLASAALGALLLSRVGALFRGSGSFGDALLAVGWVEVVMVAIQALQLAVTIVAPGVGTLLGIVTLAVALYLLVAMAMAVHGFRNPLLVILGIFGTAMLAGFALSVLAVLLGLTGAPA